MSKPPFNTDFKYDEWFENTDNKRIVDEYFGKEVKNERGDKQIIINSTI